MIKKRTILINILIFSILFFLLNVIFEKNVLKISNYINPFFEGNIQNLSADNNDKDEEEFPADFTRLEGTEELYQEFCGEKRVKFGEQYINKKPIIVFGCSYAYGHGLKKEETFSYILSQITKRPVYNFSECGGNLTLSIAGMETQIDESIVKNAEYFIYIYMYDHINRYLNQPLFLQMEEETAFREGKKLFGQNIFLIKYIASSIRMQNLLKEFPKTEKIGLYLKNLIKNKYQLIKHLNPNAKFIVVVYNEKIPLGSNVSYNVPFVASVLNSHIWKDLAMETDIKVVETKDLMGFYLDNKYRLKADFAGVHPNSKAWKELTPRLAERYIK